MWHGARTELDHVLGCRVPRHRFLKIVAQHMTRQPEKLHDSEVQLQRAMPGLLDEQVSGKKLEMWILHGSLQCLPAVFDQDVVQFLLHVCV